MAGDPNYAFRQLQIRGNGTTGATTFADLSPSPIAVTNNGGVVVSSGSTNLSENTALFDGTVNGLLITGSQARWGNLTDTFTIAFWANPTALPSSGNWCRLFMFGANSTTTGFTMQFTNDGTLIASVPYGTVTGIAAGAGTMATGGWHYYEFSMNAGTGRIFKDGAVVAGPASMTAPVSGAAQTLRIGFDTAGTVDSKYTGYLQDIIIDVGVARHTSAYSSPTALTPDYVAQVAGTIRDAAGAPCARTVHLIHRATGALIGTTTSNGTTGAYNIKTATTDEVCRIVLDDSSGSLQNDLIDRVIPA